MFRFSATKISPSASLTVPLSMYAITVNDCVSTHVVEDQRSLFVRHHGANDIFHLPENSFSLLDASAGRRPHVQTKLPRVDGRKEISSDERIKADGRQRETDHDGDR